MSLAQPTIQFNLDGDVRTVAEMASGVVPYVYEQELYGAMPMNMPRLTLGGLLLRLHRLSAITAALTPDQQRKVAEAQTAFEQMRAAWAVAYEGKLNREIDARLKALGGLLTECRDDLKHCAEVYASEIEKRVMIEHLAAEARARNTLADVQDAGIRGFDAAIRQYLETAPFIWDKRLEPAYPEERFWFLYRTAKRAKKPSV